MVTTDSLLFNIVLSISLSSGESKSFSMKQGTVEKITRYSLHIKATATKMIQSILESLLNLMLSKMSKC